MKFFKRRKPALIAVILMLYLVKESFGFNEIKKKATVEDNIVPRYNTVKIEENKGIQLVENKSFSSNNLKKRFTENSKEKIKKGFDEKDAFLGRCFHRFGNDFFDFNKIGPFEVTLKDIFQQEYKVDFKLCSNVSIENKCNGSGIAVENDSKCTVFAGDNTEEKSWILNGKKYEIDY